MSASDALKPDSFSTSQTEKLCDVLLASLKALADAGEADAACRLAGRACAALREQDRTQWMRFNKLLHRLSSMTGPVGG